MNFRDFPDGSDSNESACTVGDTGSILGLGRSLDKGMATHSSILAWRITRTEELEGYSPWGHKESDRGNQVNMRMNPNLV